MQAVRELLARFSELQRPFNNCEELAELMLNPKIMIAKKDQVELVNCSIFRNLHSFLSCCANISKLIWLGPKKDTKDLYDRGLDKETIKQINEKIDQIRSDLNLQISKTFHFKKRGLRNHIEHYNVQLFALMAETGNVSLFKICNSSNLEKRAIGTTEKNYMRVYVTDKNEYIFQGEVFDIGAMERDVDNLLILVKKMHPLSALNPSAIAGGVD